MKREAVYEAPGLLRVAYRFVSAAWRHWVTVLALAWLCWFLLVIEEMVDESRADSEICARAGGQKADSFDGGVQCFRVVRGEREYFFIERRDEGR